MTHAKNASVVEKTIQLLLLTSALIIISIIWIFFIGITYFEYTRTPGPTTEGDWSALNHIFFLILTSPLLIMTLLPLSSWVINGAQKTSIKAISLIIVLLTYGGIYLVFLWKTYPPA
ncbi:hypothetical protein [Aquitalea sp. LB_tupeE]|uniref:hypothetical protein n=1 Tax=Aquitalea sp. LB_tupeE TaxID=2748078 RepID=UPI0015BD21C6|nr:hypothetical protein [Aquitalea sp. LB_tupeE]NWK80063.1 hypothetical protein [Aquitalea sp. LB_tupeE]